MPFHDNNDTAFSILSMFTVMIFFIAGDVQFEMEKQLVSIL